MCLLPHARNAKKVISEEAAISHFQGLTAFCQRGRRSFSGQLGLSATFAKTILESNLSVSKFDGTQQFHF